MADVRIKDLASAEKQLDNFDEFEFIADVPVVDASMKLSGKQLREKITPSKHTHPISEVSGLQDALDKKFNKSGGSVSGDFAVLGNTRLRNLAVEEFLEVPEFRYNRIETVVGDKWSAAGAGIIESVDAENCILIIKLESGEISSMRKDDSARAFSITWRSTITPSRQWTPMTAKETSPMPDLRQFTSNWWNASIQAPTENGSTSCERDMNSTLNQP